MSTSPKKVVVIGAGPVGSLAALYFSHANWEVELYELRGDLRLPENLSLNFSKSINLALSDRGIDGLRNVGDNEVLLKKVLEETIPMHGRMIHSGKPSDKGMSQGYDVHGRFIRSADRWKLNVQILDALAERGNVKMIFNHGLRKMDLDAGEVEFENTFVIPLLIPCPLPPPMTNIPQENKRVGNSPHRPCRRRRWRSFRHSPSPPEKCTDVL